MTQAMPPDKGAQARQKKQKLAEQLRANLARRKQQQRARDQDAGDSAIQAEKD